MGYVGFIDELKVHKVGWGILNCIEMLSYKFICSIWLVQVNVEVTERK